MDETPPRRGLFQANFQANLIAGLLTVTPLIVVWLVFDFFLTTLSQWGHPLAVEVSDFLVDHFPMLKPWLDNDGVRWAIGVIVALLALYTIGAIASRVVGQQLIHMMERVITRIPLVETIYSAARKLVDVLRTKPGSTQRVVLIDFPRKGAKTIGFVMRTFTDANSGQELAAVFVPSTPNPTTGYLQLVPIGELQPTSITSEQAMSMVISAGAVTPEGLSVREMTSP